MTAPSPKSFAQLLRERKGRLTPSSALALYQDLGGEVELKIKYRQFLNIEAGKQAAPFSLFEAFFKRVEPAQYREVVLAFLSEHCREPKLLKFLDQYLLSVDEDRRESIRQEHLSTSAEHLRFLESHPLASKLLVTLGLHESVALSQTECSKEELRALEDFEWIRVDSKAGRIFRNRNILKLPSLREHPPKTVALGQKLCLQMAKAFLKPEASDKQKVHFQAFATTQEQALELAQHVDRKTAWFRRFARMEPRTENHVSVVRLEAFLILEDAPESIPNQEVPSEEASARKEPLRS